MAKIGLGARVVLAGKALTGLFSDRSLTQAYGLLSGLYPAATGAIPQRGTKELLEAYSTMPWLRAVAQKVSNSVAATQWVLLAPASGKKRNRIMQRAYGVERERLIAKALDDEELRPIESHILLDALTSANDYLVGPALFRTTQVHIDLVGESFWIKERSALGVPVAFWPIPPHWVVDTPTPTRRTYKVQFQTWSGEIPDTEILWLCDPDPANPYSRGSGLARSLTDELETDEYAARHSRQTFINRARPDLIIWPEASATDAGVITVENAQRLSERWRAEHQGFWRAALPYFATRKLGVKEIGQSFQDLDLVKLREFERDTIRQVWGVPPEMMGIIEPGTARATIETGEYIYEKHVVAPRREFLRAYLQERVIPEYDERLVLSYVSTIGEDRTYVLDAAKVAPWSRTVDEWRKMQNMDRLPDDMGKVFIVPLNMTPVNDISVPPPPSAASPGKPEAAPPTKRGIDLSGGWGSSVISCKEAGDIVTARLLESINASEDELPGVSRDVARIEPRIRQLVSGQLADLQARTVLASLEAAVSRRDPEAVLAQVPIAEWARDIEEPTRIWLRDAFWAGVTHAAEEAGIRLVQRDAQELPLNEVNQAALEWARIFAAALIVQISDATRQAIRDMVELALINGWGSEMAARHIYAVIGLTQQQAAAVANFAQRLAAAGVPPAQIHSRVARYAEAQRRARALTIARTELSKAANSGQQELWNRALNAGLLSRERMLKKWIVTPDERLEAVCEALGEEAPVPMDAVFSNGMHQPPAHPNCRCTTGLVPAPQARAAKRPVHHTPYDIRSSLNAAVQSAMSPLEDVMKELV